MSTKTYPYLGAAPLPGQRVMLVPLGRGYVIQAGGVGVGVGADAFNLVRNARFRINQRGSASGTSLAIGAFCVDGWKSGTAANAVTWTGSDAAGRVLTVPAAKILYQTIEQADVTAGNYLLVWKGTASAVAQNVGSPVAYVAANVGGITIAPFTLTNAAVEVGLVGGTCEWIALVRAESWAGVFPDVSVDTDLARCKRYFQALAISNVAVHNPYDQVALSAGEQYLEAPMSEMRATPLVKTTANVVPTNNVFLFGYLSRTAGGSGNLNVRITGSSPKRLAGLYSSVDNSGSSLSTNYLRGRSTTVIWLDAEI